MTAVIPIVNAMGDDGWESTSVLCPQQLVRGGYLSFYSL